MLKTFYDGYCAELEEALKAVDVNQLQNLIDLIEKTRTNGGNIYMLGNGGSAVCASHWVCDMGKGARNPNMPPIKITALSDNTAMMTAVANDISYDEAFSYQLEALAGTGDLVIGLSVSGNSPNLLRAFEFAKKMGCATACIIGDMGGKLGEMANLSIVVKSKNYGVVEDAHLILNHILSQYIRGRNS